MHAWLKLATRILVAMSFGGVIATSLAAQTTTHVSKRTKKAHPAIQADPAPASPHTVPMDFSGMDKSVKDLRNPSNARSNGQFNGEGTSGNTGISPGATFKF